MIEGKFKYFISFNYATYDNGFGFGNGIYGVIKAINDPETLNAVGEHIKNKLAEDGERVKGDVVILNFQMVKEPNQ